jgi:exo-beta-1,3-glucanase (GH17 family)/cellulose synthase/poly-beta-1,6-N-acetylglucosamine synthase-like glycosyltransferase
MLPSNTSLGPTVITRQRRTSLLAWLHPTSVLAVLVCACTAFGFWAATDQPVRIAGYSGAVTGVAFSPFRRGQGAETDKFPSEAEIGDDLKRIADMTGHIRIYTVQGGFAAIPQLAADLKLQITLGAWLSRDGNANQQELARLIATAVVSHNVDRVMVGNETLLRGDLTVAQLIAAIRQVRQKQSAPVSTAEPWHVWLAHPELAEAVDFITIHLLPYWEGIPVDQALRFTLDKLDQVQRAFPGKPIVIGEVGWPSNGIQIGGAVASRVNQAEFLRAFLNAAEKRRLDYFVMEAFDQPWKTSFEGRAAGYWGMMDLDRHAKWVMTGPVWEDPDWEWWAGVTTLVAAILALGLLSRRPDIRLKGKVLLAGLIQLFAGMLTWLLLAMSNTYLSAMAAAVWGLLAAGQTVLLVLMTANSFEWAETVWGHRPKPATLPPAHVRFPKVSIHVPIYNEPPHLVRQTLNALAELDYRDFEVLVIDNNTTDPDLWQPVADHCARLGPRFRFFHLGQWPGYKAGALNFARIHTSDDATIIGVLDSDYVVAPAWLRAMVPYFDDRAVGFVQSPQDYRDNDGSFFKRLMFWEYAGFFHLGMVTRNARNAIIQHGTMTLIRRQALEQSGGWAEWTITEDAELGLRLLRQGWRGLYSNCSFGRGVMPDDFAAFRNQRFRWAYGSIQILRRHWRPLLSPFDRQLSAGQRWHFVTGWLPWMGDALGVLFMGVAIAWSLGLTFAPMRFEFPIALFMLPSIGLFGFKLAQLLAMYGKCVPCRLRDRLGAALAGLALSHTIGRAVWKGMLIRNAPFLRTPKLRHSPAFLQGLAMASEELTVLLLNWTAIAGVAWVHRLATTEARLWCLVLLTQSMPYVAAVATSVLACRPTRQNVAHVLPTPTSSHAGSMAATTAAGD